MNENYMEELFNKIQEGKKAQRELVKCFMDELTKRAEEGSTIHIKLLAKLQGQEVNA